MEVLECYKIALPVYGRDKINAAIGEYVSAVSGIVENIIGGFTAEEIGATYAYVANKASRNEHINRSDLKIENVREALTKMNEFLPIGNAPAFSFAIKVVSDYGGAKLTMYEFCRAGLRLCGKDFLLEV